MSLAVREYNWLVELAGCQPVILPNLFDIIWHLRVYVLHILKYMHLVHTFVFYNYMLQARSRTFFVFRSKMLP